MNPREREINAPDLSSTHVVVLCAKLKEGKSRLSKDTGPEFAKEISRAMLLDILNIVSDLPIWSDFVLYFTPDDSREEASGLLNTLDERVARRWTLMPMPSEEGGENLQSSELSFKLSYVLNKMSPCYNVITFIGSDCPTLNVEGNAIFTFIFSRLIMKIVWLTLSVQLFFKVQR